MCAFMLVPAVGKRSPSPLLLLTVRTNIMVGVLLCESWGTTWGVGEEGDLEGLWCLGLGRSALFGLRGEVGSGGCLCFAWYAVLCMLLYFVRQFWRKRGEMEGRVFWWGGRGWRSCSWGFSFSNATSFIVYLASINLGVWWKGVPSLEIGESVCVATFLMLVVTLNDPVPVGLW